MAKEKQEKEEEWKGAGDVVASGDGTHRGFKPNIFQLGSIFTPTLSSVIFFEPFPKPAIKLLTFSNY